MLDHPGPAVKRIRQSQGMTQLQLSEAIGVPLSVLRDIEQGRGANSHTGTLLAWVAAMVEA